MGRTRIGRGACLALALAAAPAAAQDSHYWTNQYGTRAELLGGQVVGSIKDLACVYYNPGAMALVDKPELILTTDAFQVEALDVDSERRQGDLQSTEAGRAPSIFAIRIDAIDPLGTRGIAISFVTRHDFRAKLTDISITPADQPLPGSDYVSAENVFEQKLYESWFGATLARTYGRFGVGATLFGAYRSQSGRNQTLAAATPGTGGRAVILVDSFRYWHARLLAKIGVSWDWTDYTFGISLTTPGLGVLSDASLLSTASTTNVDGGDELVSNSQRGLEATFKSPGSIAIGASWQFLPSSAIHVSAEYFRKVDTYTVIQGEPFTGQTTGEELRRSVDNAGKSALNWGFGYEYMASAAVSVFGAFWVDRTTADGDLETDLSITNWDIYHVTAGSNFQVRGIRLTLGVSYARGSAAQEQLLDLEALGIGEPINRTADVTYQRLKGILGVSFEV